MNEPCLDDESILRVVNGKASPEEMKAAETHRSLCSICARRLEALNGLRADFDRIFPMEAEGWEEDFVFQPESFSRQEPAVSSEILVAACASEPEPASPVRKGLFSGFIKWLNEPISIIPQLDLAALSLPRLQISRAYLALVPLLGVFVIPVGVFLSSVRYPINDQVGSIGINRLGQVRVTSGGALSTQTSAWVKDLLDGRVVPQAESPLSLAENLTSNLQFLGGESTNAAVPSPVSPKNTLVNPVGFRFRWESIPNAVEYELKLRGPGDVVHVETVRGTNEVSSAALDFKFEPGIRYRWLVEAILPPEVLDLSISAEAQFVVLDQLLGEDVARLESEHGQSFVIRAAVYLRYGLLDDAEAMIEQVSERNGDDPIVDRIRASLEAARID